MLITSQDYLDKINASFRTTDIVAVIRINGVDEQLTSADFVEGSISYDNCCMDNDKFQLGSTYAGRIRFSLYKSYNLIDLIGAQVNVTVKVLMNTIGTYQIWQNVTLGQYEITEAKQEVGYISLVGYDHLCNGNVNDYSPYVSKINTKPSSALGIYANNYEGIGRVDYRNIDNYTPTSGAQPIKLNCNLQDYNTIREFMSDVAQILGCFVTNSRSHYSQSLMPYISLDYYELKRLGENTVTIAENNIKSLKVSSSNLHYDGVMMHVGSYVYTAGDMDGDSIYEFTTKALKDNTDEEKQKFVDKLWNEVISLIDATPVEFDYVGDPSLEVGDKILIPNNGSYITSYVTSIDYKYRGIERIRCAGFNTALSKNTMSATAKEQERIKSELNGKNRIIHKTVTNYQPSSIFSDFFVSDEINISEANTFLIEGYISLTGVSGATQTIDLRCYQKVGTGAWNQVGYDMHKLIDYSVTTLPFCFPVDLSDSDKPNYIKLQIKSNKGSATSFPQSVGDIAIVGNMKQ